MFAEPNVVQPQFDQVVSKRLQLLKALWSELVVRVDEGPEELSLRLDKFVNRVSGLDLSRCSGKNLRQHLVAHLARIDHDLTQACHFIVFHELHISPSGYGLFETDLLFKKIVRPVRKVNRPRINGVRGVLAATYQVILVVCLHLRIFSLLIAETILLLNCLVE